MYVYENVYENNVLLFLKKQTAEVIMVDSQYTFENKSTPMFWINNKPKQ